MDTALRVVLAYVIVVAGLRISGKRTFGEMSPADLVVLMLIPEFLQQAVMRDDFSLVNGAVAVSSLILVTMVTEALAYRFPKLEAIVSGKQVTVASHGRLRGEVMDLERLPPDEVTAAMNRAGIERLEQVKWAILLPDGTIAIIPEDSGKATPDQARRKSHKV